MQFTFAGFLLLFVFLSPGCSLNSDFAGLINIGSGREMYLQCQGSGSPTVIFVSGFRGAHDDWTTVIEGGKETKGNSSVFTQVSLFSRVCAYDRPGTTLLDGSYTLSTPVTQPTTAQQGAADLHGLLFAAGEAGPYVVVAHSWGGLNGYLFASKYGDEVEGLVLVDSASAFLQSALTSEEWAKFVDGAKEIGVPAYLEAADYLGSIEAIRSANWRSIPSVVITSDQPFDFGAGQGTWPAWLLAQDLLAKRLGAKHVTHTNSGHFIQGEQPQVVIEAIHELVDATRMVSKR